MTHLALLRGINVGGKARLPMADLREIFVQSGATAVRTYIQSGNVLFDCDDAALCAAEVTRIIAQRFGYPGRILLRTAAELHQAAESHPFMASGVVPETLHVFFLADTPAPDAVLKLDANRSPGDRFALVDREIYLYLPQGMARTRLTNAYFDTTLRTASTARNWNTVLRLKALSTPEDGQA